MPITTRVRSVKAGAAGADKALAEAAALLREGRMVAFPTETVYGLGADATSEAAVSAVYEVKRRPPGNPLIVHVADEAQLERVCVSGNPHAAPLIDAFWPGPLTLVLPAREAVRETVSRGLGTVGVRCPAHPIALELIRRSGLPIAAPSANISGRPSPTTAVHVRRDLEGRIPLILDGGPCPIGLESTVLDLTSHQPAILRPGHITSEMIEEVLDLKLAEGGAPWQSRSPGTRHPHYRPETLVMLLDSRDTPEEIMKKLRESGSERIGFIGTREPVIDLVEAKSTRVHADFEEMAREFYADLRELDDLGLDLILVESPPESASTAALRDRLARAGSGRIRGNRSADHS